MARGLVAKGKVLFEDKSKSGLDQVKLSLLKFKKGVSSSLDGIKTVGTGAAKGISNIGNAIKGVGIAALALTGVNASLGALKDTVKEFQEAQKSNIQMAQAISNSPFLNGESYKSLKIFADEIQNLTGYENDLIKVEVNKLAAMGLNEEAIKKSVKAATNLSASGVMPLSSAIEALGKTYSGTAGTLTRTLPALKNLTKEQLEQGKAVDYVAKAYAGMAQKMTLTDEGIYKGFQNQMKDLQEAIGESLSHIGTELIKNLKPALENITQWIQENSFKFVNFFMNIPELASLAFSVIPRLLEKVFSWETIKNFFQGIWTYYVKFLPALFKGLFDGIKNWFAAVGLFIAGLTAKLWLPIYGGFMYVVNLIHKGFVSLVNFFISGINNISSIFNEILNTGLGQKLLEALGVGGFKVELIEELKTPEDYKKPEGSYEDRANKVRETAYAKGLERLQKTGQALISPLDEAIAVISPLAAEFGDVLDPIKEKMNAIINKPLINSGLSPEDIANNKIKSDSSSGNYLDYYLKSSEDSANKSRGELEKYETEQINLLKSLKESLGLDKLKEAFSGGSGSWGGLGKGSGTDLLSNLLGPVAGGISQFFSSIMPLLNPFQLLGKVIEGFLSVIQPAIDIVLKPLFSTLTVIGQMLGTIFLPIFDAISPVLQIIAQMLMTLTPIFGLLIPFISIVAGIFEFLSTPLKYFAVALEYIMAPIKWCADLFEFFGNVIKTIAHNIANIVSNILTPWKIHLDALPTFTSDAFSGLKDRVDAILNTDYSTNLAGNDLSSTLDNVATNSGTQASYGGTQEIYITIENNGYVVGSNGLEEFAKIIRTEFDRLAFYNR